MGWRRSVLIEIGVDGVLVMGWRRRGKKKILKKKKKDGEEREAEIEIRLVWRRRGYSEKKEGLGGGRREIIKKVRENIILIKKCV